jgi:hypothetical protein
MKLTLIYLPVLLLGSQIVLAADPVPKIDIVRSCQSAGATAGAATRDKTACEQSENNARATLEKEWSQFAPSDRTRCARLITVGGGPSYVELLTCLELAKGANELPAADQMDRDIPSEKSRHPK